MKNKFLFAFVFIALLILPIFATDVKVYSAGVFSYNGAIVQGAYSTVYGNRTCSGIGSTCNANLTIYFDMLNYSYLNITNFRIKHAFEIPSGGAGWVASGSYADLSIIGLAQTKDFLEFGQASPELATCNATNSSGGVLFKAGDFNGNNSYLDFNCTLPISKRYLAITFAGDASKAVSIVANSKGTSAFGRDWGIMEFVGENVTGSNLTTTAYDWGLTLNHTVIAASYTFYGCSQNSTNYTCHIAVALPNGTIATSTNWTYAYQFNYTCSIGNPIQSITHQLPENPSEPQLPLGLYQVLTTCFINGNVSQNITSQPVWIDTSVIWTPPATTTTLNAVPSGMAGNAILTAVNDAGLFWYPWIASNGSLIFGLFVAMLILIAFFVMAANFNMPILAIVGVILAAFISLVVLLLTSPSGMLIFIVVLLLLIVIGAFAAFKGLSA